MNQQNTFFFVTIMSCIFAVLFCIINMHVQTDLYNQRVQHLNNIEANLIVNLDKANNQLIDMSVNLNRLERKVDKIPTEKEYDVSQMFWNHTRSTFASGYYVPNAGFWVDTRGKFLNEINETLHHEMLHALISQDIKSKRHFCFEENVE